VSSCTSAFYKPILVSDFLNDTTTFRNSQERLAHLRGLRVQLSYEPVHNGSAPRSQAATIDARIKTIAGTGLPVCDQTFQLKGQNGNPGAETTVKDHFEKSEWIASRTLLFVLTIAAYHTNLMITKMPAINCGRDSRPTWYPAEKLSILPYQLFKRTVPDTLTADMLDVACNLPETTRALIEHEGLQKLGLIPGQGVTSFVSCHGIPQALSPTTNANSVHAPLFRSTRGYSKSLRPFCPVLNRSTRTELWIWGTPAGTF
jgi:eukaryotic translation initiation factor 2C